MSDTVKCPLCGEAIPAGELQTHMEADNEEIQAVVINAIKQQHPEWVEKDGTCARCWDHYRRL